MTNFNKDRETAEQNKKPETQNKKLKPFDKTLLIIFFVLLGLNVIASIVGLSYAKYHTVGTVVFGYTIIITCYLALIMAFLCFVLKLSANKKNERIKKDMILTGQLVSQSNFEDIEILKSPKEVHGEEKDTSVDASGTEDSNSILTGTLAEGSSSDEASAKETLAKVTEETDGGRFKQDEEIYVTPKSLEGSDIAEAKTVPFAAYYDEDDKQVKKDEPVYGRFYDRKFIDSLIEDSAPKPAVKPEPAKSEAKVTAQTEEAKEESQERGTTVVSSWTKDDLIAFVAADKAAAGKELPEDFIKKIKEDQGTMAEEKFAETFTQTKAENEKETDINKDLTQETEEIDEVKNPVVAEVSQIAEEPYVVGETQATEEPHIAKTPSVADESNTVGEFQINILGKAGATGAHLGESPTSIPGEAPISNAQMSAMVDSISQGEIPEAEKQKSIMLAQQIELAKQSQKSVVQKTEEDKFVPARPVLLGPAYNTQYIAIPNAPSGDDIFAGGFKIVPLGVPTTRYINDKPVYVVPMYTENINIPSPVVQSTPEYLKTGQVSGMAGYTVAPAIPSEKAQRASATEYGAGKKKVVKKLFAEKVLSFGEFEKHAYNELKNEILSYQYIRSKISTNFDSFRSKRVNLAKISMGGKTLKLFLALDPEAFDEKRYRQTDMSSRISYEEVPFMVKIKSELAIRRAKELIASLMEKYDIAKDKVYRPQDFAGEIVKEQTLKNKK